MSLKIEFLSPDLVCYKLIIKDYIMTNKKKTSDNLASKAAKILSDKNSSATAKKLAGSALSQSNSDKQTGSELEDFASKVLKSPKYNDDTKSLAGSVLSQSNKSR